MASQRKTHGDCKVHNCWQKAIYKTSGLCGACYQNIRLHQFQTPTELMSWARRVERLRSRVALITSTSSSKLRRVK